MPAKKGLEFFRKDVIQGVRCSFAVTMCGTGRKFCHLGRKTAQFWEVVALSGIVRHREDVAPWHGSGRAPLTCRKMPAMREFTKCKNCLEKWRNSAPPAKRKAAGRRHPRGLKTSARTRLPAGPEVGRCILAAPLKRCKMPMLRELPMLDEIARTEKASALSIRKPKLLEAIAKGTKVDAK
jgi:hypothetical protein